MSRAALLSLVLSLTLVACASSESAERKEDAPPLEEPAAAAAPEEDDGDENDDDDDSTKLPGEAQIAEGVYVAGQPTKEQLQSLPARGIELVINLRGRDEPGALADEQAIVEGAGMTYVHLDAGKGADALTEDNAKKLADALHEAGPALVHCGSGNRAAALYGLKAAVADGDSDEDAIEIVEKTGNDKLLEKLKEALKERAAK